MVLGTVYETVLGHALRKTFHVSVIFLAGHGEICPPHMGDPHGDPQTSRQHADPHGLGAFLKKTIQEILVDRRVVGWSAGRHVDHACGAGGELANGLLEKSLNVTSQKENTKRLSVLKLFRISRQNSLHIPPKMGKVQMGALKC